MKDYLFVFKKVREILTKYGLPELYTSYASTLHSIIGGSTPELQEALKGYKERIKLAHDDFAALEWTINQREILARLGADNLIGGAGYRAFKGALTEKGVNPEGAVAEIQKQAESLKTLFNKVTTLSTELDDVVNGEEEPLPKGYMSLELVFSEDARIDTVPNWKKQANAWYLIAHSAKLLDKDHPVDISLPQMSKNSPLDAILCGPYIQIASVGSIFYMCLKLYEKILKIVQLHVEIDKLEVQVASEKVDLEKKVIEKEKAIKEAEIEYIVRTAVDKFGSHLNKTEKNNASTALNKAVPYMYEYVKDGGQLQFKDKTEDPDNEDMKNFEIPDIKTLSSDVKKLQAYMEYHRQLEAKNKTEAEDTESNKEEDPSEP